MLIRFFATAFALQIATNCIADEAPSKPSDSQKRPCELRLLLPKEGGTKMVIRNVGEQSVTLVMPGDGSASHWRTPIVSWSFLPVNSQKEHPQNPPRPTAVLRCGNINSLRAAEVFVLQPGQTRDVSKWFNCLTAPDTPGKYRVVGYYSNVPDLKWSGVPLGKHDEKAMEAVKRSTSRVAYQQ